MNASKAEPSAPLLAVQHAARLFRAGGVVGLEANGLAWATVAAETVMEESPAALRERLPRRSLLLLTGQRLQSLGAVVQPDAIHALSLDEFLDIPGLIATLADPTAPPLARPEVLAATRPATLPVAAAVIELCKVAGLLPAAVLAPEGESIGGAATGAELPIADVLAYRRLAAASLRPVSEARVPLVDAEEARVVSFRPADGGPEQFAILVGEPEHAPAPLARLHSECFTGDLLGSLRCDCGDQLRGAIRRMAHEGAGVLLYLAQEGRGIGLTNKLRAYLLQDQGLDTVDANHHLGFANDERDFWAAAAMLRQLGIERVRLLTNNPAKIDQLRRHGIDVVGRVPHIFAANAHNRGYLLTKAQRSGHMLAPEDIEPGSSGRPNGCHLTVV